MIKINRVIESCPFCGDEVDNISFEYHGAHLTDFECMCRRCSAEFKTHACDWEDMDAIDKFNKRPDKPDINKNFFVGVGQSVKGSETL